MPWWFTCLILLVMWALLVIVVLRSEWTVNRPWIEKGALCILAGGLVWALGSKTVREQFDRASTLAPTAEATLSPTPTTTPPFRAEVQTVMNYSPVGRQLTDFVVAYGPASIGFVSPVPFLMHIQVTNLQNIRSAITEYVVEIGLGDKGPWHSLSPISLTDCELYYLSNLKHPSPAVGGGLRLSEGSYIFRTPRDPSNLTTAIQLKPNRILEDELGRDIEPHNSIQGWAAFDKADGSVTVFEGQNIFYRITVNDSAGVLWSTILRMPLGSRKGERIADTRLGTLLQTGVVRDLHNRQLRPYTLK
jgi:hypothetical protein